MLCSSCQFAITYSVKPIHICSFNELNPSTALYQHVIMPEVCIVFKANGLDNLKLGVFHESKVGEVYHLMDTHTQYSQLMVCPPSSSTRGSKIVSSSTHML